MIKDGTNPYFVAETETGYVVIGDEQLFKGYSLLLYKEHSTELYQLDRDSKMKFLEEMSLVAEAMSNAFSPDKMNYELLGNKDEHMHWHLFPRRKTDPVPGGPVWKLPKEQRTAEEWKIKNKPEELKILKNQLLVELKKVEGLSVKSQF